jgi:hypothetical protein
MTAKQATQKNFQRIDLDALESLLKADASLRHVMAIKTRFVGFLKSLMGQFF